MERMINIIIEKKKGAKDDIKCIGKGEELIIIIVLILQRWYVYYTLN